MDLVFYFDDDVTHHAASIGREKGVAIITSNDAGMRGARDNDHAAYAMEKGYVLVTANIQDFRPLYARHYEHPGVVFITSDHRTNAVAIAEELEVLAYAALPEDIQNMEWWI